MENSYALLALLFTLVFIAKIIQNRKPNQKHPRGPKPWPIIGNLNQLAGSSLPHQTLHYLSQKYGDIMLLKFGKCPVVVASSPEMAKQFLKVHDTVFASRPSMSSGKYTSYNYSNMVWAPNGPYWRQARAIFHSKVFNAKKMDMFEHVRVDERRRFLSRLRSLSGKPVVLKDQLAQLTLCSVSRMAFGNKNLSEMEELQGLLDEWFLLNGVFNIGDWIPWLNFLDLQGFVKRMKGFHKKVDRLYDHVIDDHQARMVEEKEHFSPKDWVDVLLQKAEDPNLEVKLTRDCIKGLLQDLLAGGTDTVVTTVEWAVYEMLRQARILEKAKEELDRVMGRNRWVDESDFSQLPYIDAIIAETFRLHPLATMLAPHYAIEDCNVAGYDISKGTVVIINTWSIGRDPNSWDAPQDFLPERFMGKQIDMLGSNFALLPFGSGRRSCPGYSLGLKIVRTTLANVLHGFELKLVDGMRPEDICMEEAYGITTHPKQAMSIIIKPTLPPNLY